MPQNEARDEAIRRAKARIAEHLESVSESLEERCSRLGLGLPENGVLEFSAFDSPALLDLATLDLTRPDLSPLPQADRILIYHYLACDSALSCGGDPISFRDFPGGAFYWEPFRARTALPLAKRFGGDIALGTAGGASRSAAQSAPELRSALGRFEWSELPLGDFSARVRGFGRLYLIIVAYAPEEGLDADFNVLFESAALRAFGAEDAAAFASRICLSLLKPAV